VTQTPDTEGSFWPDTLAESIVAKRGDYHVVATGITPSGPIHLGNIREVLSGDAVYRALNHAGTKAKLIYIADTFDPLRSVYPFLPDDYAQYVGMPLYAIPDPEGCCENYAEHFLKPFLAALDELGVEVEAYRAHEMYKEGLYSDVAVEAVANSAKIAEIIGRLSGRELPEGWISYNPECSECGRITGPTVTGADPAGEWVDYECVCGHSDRADVRAGQGKLPWRVDWPARWKVLGVTAEPFGKDHAASGGSYETGSEIVRDVFGAEPPEPIVYEWIYLKGQGAMASSTGLAISINDILGMVPPAAVRCFVLRPRPEKHIDFDPVNGIPGLHDEYEKFEKTYFSTEDTADQWSRRIYEISQPGEIPSEIPSQVPFVHLTVAAQAAGGSGNGALEVIGRSGYSVRESDRPSVLSQIERAKVWLSEYAPDAYKFSIHEAVPDATRDLSDEQVQFLGKLSGVLAKVDWDPDTVQSSIFELGKESGLNAKKAFGAVYTSVIGRNSGPRAGYFISSLDRDWVVARMEEVSAL